MVIAGPPKRCSSSGLAAWTQSPDAFVLDEPSTVECAEKFSSVTNGLPVVVARLQHAHVGVDDLVGLVVVELVGEQVAARRGPVVERAGRHRLEARDDRVDGLVEDVLEVLVGNAAPHAERVGARVAVVALDDDVLGRQYAARAPLDLLAHVDQAVGAVLHRGEPALRLDVGDREHVVAVGHRKGAHAEAVAEDAGGRRPASTGLPPPMP